ncbi:hypothetical protein ABK040_010139 [Willaertia magna]
MIKAPSTSSAEENKIIDATCLKTRTIKEIEPTPFVIQYKSITQLPDELFIEIFQFLCDSPFQIVTISHVCSYFNQLVNNEFLIWQYIPLVLSKKELNNNNQITSQPGHLLLKYFNKNSPIYFNNLKYKHILQQFDLQYKQRIENNLQLTSEKKLNLLKIYKKPIIVCKDQFIELLKHLKKEKEDISTLRRRREWLDGKSKFFEDYILHSFFILFGVLILLIFLGTSWYGSVRNNYLNNIVNSNNTNVINNVNNNTNEITTAVVENNYLTLDGDFWWLSYLFIPIYLLMINFGLIVKALAINEYYKFKSKSDRAMVAIVTVIYLYCVFIFFILKYTLFRMTNNYKIGYWAAKFFPPSYTMMALPFIIISGLVSAIIFTDSIKKAIIFNKHQFPYILGFQWNAINNKIDVAIFIAFGLGFISLLNFSLFMDKFIVHYFISNVYVTVIPLVVALVFGGIVQFFYNFTNDFEFSVLGFSVISVAWGIVMVMLEIYNYLTFGPLVVSYAAFSAIVAYKRYKRGY